MTQRTERKPYRRDETVDPLLRVSLAIGPRRFIIREQTHEESPNHPSVSVSVFKPLSSIDLTVLTGLELEELRRFWNDAIDRAKPIVDQLDQLAKDASEQGDLSYKRLWRPDPIRLDF